MNNINYLLADILDLEQNHPTLMKIAVDFAEIAAAIAMVVGPAMTLIGVLGWLKTSGTIAAGLQMIGSAINFMTFGLAGNATAWVAQKVAMSASTVATQSSFKERSRLFRAPEAAGLGYFNLAVRSDRNAVLETEA